MAIILLVSHSSYTYAEGNLEYPNEELMRNIEARLSKSSKSNIRAEEISYVQDFDNNQYAVINLEPNGYAIVHPETEVIIEYNLQAESPFTDKKGLCLYGGPTYYYTSDNGIIKHTMFDECLSAQEIELMRKQSANMNKELNELKGKNDVTNDIASMSSINSVTSSSDVWITGYTFFKNRYNNFGYIPGGYCGFIAANFLLKYFNYRGLITLPTSHASLSSTTLTNTLKTIGNNASPTYASTLKTTINTYATQYNIPKKAGWDLLLTGVEGEININHQPCIIYGNLPGAGNHAAIVYGYNQYENPGYYTFVCHYGWNGTATSNQSQVHICALNSTWEANVKYKVY